MIEPLRHLWAARPFRNSYLLRGGVAWLGVRFMGAWAGIAIGNPLVSLIVVGAAAAMVLIDARRRNEDLFLGNLGIGTWAVLVIAGLPAVVIEATLHIAVGR